MADKLTYAIQLGMIKIPWLPDKIEKPIAYLIVFAVGFVACWRGHYSLFSALEFTFDHEYEGWIFTALVVSGGSKFLREASENMDVLPGFLTNTYGAARRIVTGVTQTGGTTTTTTKQTTQAQATQPLEGRDSL